MREFDEWRYNENHHVVIIINDKNHTMEFTACKAVGDKDNIHSM